MIELYSIKDRNFRSLGHSHTETEKGFRVFCKYDWLKVNQNREFLSYVTYTTFSQTLISINENFHKVSTTQGHKVRRDTLIFFLDKNVRDMSFGLIYPATKFYVWFSTIINQENQFQGIPPYIMFLVPLLKLHQSS